MKVWTLSVCYNEARMVPWFLRHYSPLVERMIVWDDFSTDGTRELLKANPKVDLRDWPYPTGLDDDKFLLMANEWYREARGKADFIAVVDMDELLYHPDLLGVLKVARGDLFPSTGFALISPNGWPKDDGTSQIYDLVRTGVPQSNYNKKLLVRPSVQIQHTYGRHTYVGLPGWPRHNGSECADAGIKLLHLHHVGGITDTVARNARNSDRANNKKYAWSYAAEHNKPEQNGSEAWVRDAIENNKLIEVIPMPDKNPTPTLRKLQFGCGRNKLAGWENYDAEVRIERSLPFKDGCASFLFAEHCIEHITHCEAWLFMEECRRILQPGGVVRIAIPDIVRLSKRMTQEYANAVKASGIGDGSFQFALKAAVFEHGHKAAWTAQLLVTFMEAIGFKAEICAMGQSRHPELNGIEGHGKVVGESIALVETSVVEGTK